MIYRLLMKLWNRSAPRQQSNLRITGLEIRELLEQLPCWTANSDFKRADKSYKLVNTAALKVFLASNTVSDAKYTVDSFDCDDFSFALMGDISKWDSDLAFGIVWISGHALNWFVDEDRHVWFVEPQSDKIFEPESDRKIAWCVA